MVEAAPWPALAGAYATSMFPAEQRRSPASLEELVTSLWCGRIWDQLPRDAAGAPASRPPAWIEALRVHLPAALRTRLLARCIPAQDPWRYPCLLARDHTQCRHHVECRMTYHYGDRLVALLFTPDVAHLSLDLRRIAQALHASVLTRVDCALATAPPAGSALTQLVIQGGSPHSDHLVPLLENLCQSLGRLAPHLTEFVVPVCSNAMLFQVSDYPQLLSFKADRSQRLNRRGLWHLCHPEAVSRGQLEVLELGVFKQRYFQKLDVAKFFSCMQSLKSFSLKDEERCLMRVDHPGNGAKVLVYSVVKLGIIDAESGHHVDQFPDGIFRCRLTDMKVVDRRLNPDYLLAACPNLEKLTIDWQEYLAWPPFVTYPIGWFAQMIRMPSWPQLASTLSQLSLIFPAFHCPSHYGLPLEDVSALFQSLSNLQSLTLRGGGSEAPLPLSELLRSCPKLRYLTLEKTSVVVPQDYEVIDAASISQHLVSFSLVNGHVSVSSTRNITAFILYYMPALERLQLQPETTFAFSGLKPTELEKLAGLRHLQRLSVALSLKCYIMNLPEIIFILRKFPQLRFLTISWGKAYTVFNEIGTKRMNFMTDWLFSALQAENANIHLEVDFMVHGNSLVSK